MIKKLICGSGDGTQGFLQAGKHATHSANFLLGGSSFHSQGWVDLTLKDLILRQPCCYLQTLLILRVATCFFPQCIFLSFHLFCCSLGKWVRIALITTS